MSKHFCINIVYYLYTEEIVCAEPRTEPCVRPLVIFISLQCIPLYFTICFLLDK